MTEQDKEAQFEEILAYYKGQKERDQETLVMLLREVQELFGCISERRQEEIGRALNIQALLIRKLIKLYPSLKSVSCLHRVIVCTGPKCAQEGAADILNVVKEEAVRRGDLFEVVVRSCLKHCRTAPNMMVDDDLYTNVSPENVRDILKKY